MSVANGMTPTRRGATPPGGVTTFDLFSWSEGPDVTRRSSAAPVIRLSSDTSAVADQSTCDDSPVGRPNIRMQQPAGGISTITFGEHISAEEADALLKRRPGSDSKKREMHGSGIFAAAAAAAGGDGDGDGNGTSTPAAAAALLDRTSVRYHQAAGGVSQISFGGENCASPRKAVTVPEVAKQKELSGTVETTDDLAARRVNSNAKAKELVGSNIFGPPLPETTKPCRALDFKSEQDTTTTTTKGGAGGASEEVPPPPHRILHTSVKVSNPAGGHCQISFGPKDESDLVARKMHDHKKAELSGHDIFSEEKNIALVTASSHNNHRHQHQHHHHMSQAKLKELSGSDIFSDHKPASRDFIGGIRKPPGGGSTISLQ